MNIICFGSSITAAGGFAEKDRWPTILQYHLEQWRPGKYSVYNRGVGGNTTAHLIDRFQADVLPLLPGTVILQIGGNDSSVREWSQVTRVGLSDFRRNLHEFHRAVTSLGGQLVFTTYHRFRDGHEEAYKPFAVTTREVAAERGAPLIDLYRIMQERETDLDRFVSGDGIHLTPAGNAEYADMVFGGLQKILA